jgi:hypothetical protein
VILQVSKSAVEIEWRLNGHCSSRWNLCRCTICLDFGLSLQRRSGKAKVEVGPVRLSSKATRRKQARRLNIRVRSNNPLRPGQHKIAPETRRYRRTGMPRKLSGQSAWPSSAGAASITSKPWRMCRGQVMTPFGDPSGAVIPGR